MTDLQLVILCLSVIAPVAMLTGRISDLGETLRADAKAAKAASAELSAQLNRISAQIDALSDRVDASMKEYHN